MSAKVGEATRQYQATLEARRTLASHDAFSFDEERAFAEAELMRAEAEMVRVWLESAVA